MPTLFTMNADANDFIAGELKGAGGLKIHFDIAFRGWLNVGDTVRPSMLNFKRVTGYVRSDGRMYDTAPVSAAPFDINDPGTFGVRLPANDPDLHLPADVTYNVSGSRLVAGKAVPFTTFNTGPVPSTDVAVNLASYAPGPQEDPDDVDDGEPVDGGGAGTGEGGNDPVDGGGP